ncbi:hypothetical protein ACVBOS_001173 [Vibrio vulnificus]
MTYEEELLSELKNSISNGKIKVEDDSGKYFSELGQSYPTFGSKIDWDEIENSVVKDATEEDCDAQFVSFFKTVSLENSLQGECIVIGDSAIDKALRMDINTLESVLLNIVEIPQHHYIVASDLSWCMTYTMEREMAFGFKPE